VEVFDDGRAGRDQGFYCTLVEDSIVDNEVQEVEDAVSTLDVRWEMYF